MKNKQGCNAGGRQYTQKGKPWAGGWESIIIVFVLFCFVSCVFTCFLTHLVRGGGSHIEPLHARQSVLPLGYIPVFSVSSYTAGFALFLWHSSGSCALKQLSHSRQGQELLEGFFPSMLWVFFWTRKLWWSALDALPGFPKPPDYAWFISNSYKFQVWYP